MTDTEYKGGDVMFAIDDARDLYTPAQANAILSAAKVLGYPMDHETYLQYMSLEQLDRCLRGQFDA